VKTPLEQLFPELRNIYLRRDTESVSEHYGQMLYILHMILVIFSLLPKKIQKLFELLSLSERYRLKDRYPIKNILLNYDQLKYYDIRLNKV
jgi:hypothetical protein